MDFFVLVADILKVLAFPFILIYIVYEMTGNARHKKRIEKAYNKMLAELTDVMERKNNELIKNAIKYNKPIEVNVKYEREVIELMRIKEGMMRSDAKKVDIS
ncbi:hypothetical protein [Oceanobacillus oncorhynchi]|uniref:hypothetical protein n=1 Tax=Oceanobacillus oncorhynchi TaxID=545501 RepID=UPI001867A24C|nr:hypothetical protein [Oceanobacillus oncorhynchi]